MDDGVFQEQLIRRLDIIIRLLLDQSQGDSKPSIGEAAAQLVEMGLPPAQIAPILGKPRKQVTSALAKLKKAKGKGKR
jgi:hypothetical protein